MPTYEYLCSACQNAWEEIQKISEAPIEVCPKCHKSTARRQISGGNFILKGGGWYADLYSSSSGKKADKDKGDSNGASSSDAKKGESEAKSESKAESKTESKTDTNREVKAETKPAATTPPKTPAKSD